MAGFFNYFRGSQTPETKSDATQKALTEGILGALDAENDGASADLYYNYQNASEIIANPIARKCIDVLAASGSSVKLYATKNGKAVPNNDPLQKVLNQPNSYTSINAFLDTLIRHYLLAGEAYVHRVTEQKDFQSGFGQIFVVRPEYVQPQSGQNVDFPAYWSISPVVGPTFTEKVDQVNGSSRLLQIKDFNPVELYRGKAKAASAYSAVVAYNSGTIWNAASLTSGAKFSMILQKDEAAIALSGEDVSQDQWKIFGNIVRSFTANKNGSVLIPNIPVKMEELSRSPKDMQLTESQDSTSRQIAVAFGVPGQIAGIPGDSTYANFEQANYALYNQTVIPMMEKIASELGMWIQSVFPGQGYDVCIDIDSIEAIKDKRTESMAAIQVVNFLSIDEKRELYGFTPLANGAGQVVPGTVQVSNNEQTPPSSGDINGGNS